MVLCFVFCVGRGSGVFYFPHPCFVSFFVLCFLVSGLCCVVLCVGVVCFFVLWCFVFFDARGGCCVLCFVLWCGIFVVVADSDGFIVRLGGYDG